MVGVGLREHQCTPPRSSSLSTGTLPAYPHPAPPPSSTHDAPDVARFCRLPLSRLPQEKLEQVEKALEHRNAEYAGLYDYCGQVIGERDAALEEREAFSQAAAAAEAEVAALQKELEELREELADKEQRVSSTERARQRLVSAGRAWAGPGSGARARRSQGRYSFSTAPWPSTPVLQLMSIALPWWVFSFRCAFRNNP